MAEQRRYSGREVGRECCALYRVRSLTVRHVRDKDGRYEDEGIGDDLEDSGIAEDGRVVSFEERLGIYAIQHHSENFWRAPRVV